MLIALLLSSAEGPLPPAAARRVIRIVGVGTPGTESLAGFSGHRFTRAGIHHVGGGSRRQRLLIVEIVGGADLFDGCSSGLLSARRLGWGGFDANPWRSLNSSLVLFTSLGFLATGALGLLDRGIGCRVLCAFGSAGFSDRCAVGQVSTGIGFLAARALLRRRCFAGLRIIFGYMGCKARLAGIGHRFRQRLGIVTSPIARGFASFRPGFGPRLAAAGLTAVSATATAATPAATLGLRLCLARFANRAGAMETVFVGSIVLGMARGIDVIEITAPVQSLAEIVRRGITRGFSASLLFGAITAPATPTLAALAAGVAAFCTAIWPRAIRCSALGTALAVALAGAFTIPPRLALLRFFGSLVRDLVFLFLGKIVVLFLEVSDRFELGHELIARAR